MTDRKPYGLYVHPKRFDRAQDDYKREGFPVHVDDGIAPDDWYVILPSGEKTDATP